MHKLLCSTSLFLFPFFFILLLLLFFLNDSTVIWKDFAQSIEKLPALNLVPVCPPSSAVAVITPERSPRPTSAPAIAQSHSAEPAPAKSNMKDMATSKVGKEAAKSDVRREEFPPEKAEEPVDASKVGLSGVSWEELGWSIAQGSHPKAATLFWEMRGSSLSAGWEQAQGSGCQGNPSSDIRWKKELQGSWVLVVVVKASAAC